MSYEAMRSVMTARDAGAIDGGPTLLVGLVLASGAARRSGEITAGVRRLAVRCGLSKDTTARAVRDLVAAGVVEPTGNRGGRRPSRYTFASSTWDAKLGDNGPLVSHQEDANGRRNTGVVSHQGDTNGPRAVEIPAHADAAKEHHQQPTVVVGAVPVQNLRHKPEASAAAAAQARYAAELTDPADIPARVGDLRAAVDAEPEPLALAPEDDAGRPEGVVAPEDVPGYVEGVRARMRPRHG